MLFSLAFCNESYIPVGNTPFSLQDVSPLLCLDGFPTLGSGVVAPQSSQLSS